MAASGRLTVEFEPAGAARLVPLDPGVDGSLAAVAAGAFEAMGRGAHWGLPTVPLGELRPLAQPLIAVVLEHYCGNRTKTRAYRRRKEAAC